MAGSELTRFYVVRHGNTFEEGEAPRRIGARSDPGLTATGQRQGESLGKSFYRAGVSFDRAFTSPLARTTETCKLILQFQDNRNPSMEQLDFLTEIDYGPDEDLAEPDVIARVGIESILAWDREAVPARGWIVKPLERVAAWRQFFRAHGRTGGDTALLLVTSSGAARFALRSENNLLAASNHLASLKLRTGACGRIDVDADHSKLVYWNLSPEDAQDEW